MKDITLESLFYSGGTIAESEIIKSGFGHIAINDNYIFFANDKSFKAIKYELNTEFTYKLLKTKIKIINKESFLKFMEEDLFYANKKKIFAFYLNN